jgi:putative phage-type endonuclease
MARPMIPFTPADQQLIAAQLGHCPGTIAELLDCPDEMTWLEKRRDGIGASEVGVIVGASQWSSPYALWWRKKLDWRIPGDETMRWGHLVEDPIATLFAEQTADTLYLAKPLGHPYSLWHHPVQKWAMCTPDRLAVRLDTEDVVPVEIKSDEGGSGWGAPGTDEVPDQYRCQALWQAFVFGAAGTYVVRKRSSGRGRVTWYWVPLEGSMRFVELFDAAWNFLVSIEDGDPPEPDGSSSTEDVLRERYAVEDETFAGVPTSVYEAWDAAREAKKQAMAADKLATNRMREAMGTAQFATVRTDDGLDVVVAKRRVGKRAGYEVPAGTVDELRRVGSGSQPSHGAVPGPDDAAPPSSTGTEERGNPLRAGGGVGDRDCLAEGEAAAGEDPRGAAPDRPIDEG